MPFESPLVSACDYIPQPDCSVASSIGERTPIWTNYYTIVRRIFRFENLLVNTCDCIPQMNLTSTRTSKCSAIRTERYASDRMCIPSEYSLVFARDSIPQPDGVVTFRHVSAPTGERPSIRTER